jgi:hypothetical protein
MSIENTRFAALLYVMRFPVPVKFNKNDIHLISYYGSNLYYTKVCNGIQREKEI